MNHLMLIRKLRIPLFMYVLCVMGILPVSSALAAAETVSVSIEKFELKQNSVSEYTWEVTVLNKGKAQADGLTLQISHKTRTSADNFIPIENGTQAFSFDTKQPIKSVAGSSPGGRQIPGADAQQPAKKLSGSYVFYHPYDRLRAKVIQNGKTLAYKDVDLPRLSIKIGPVSFIASDTPGRVKWQSTVTNEGILPISNLSVRTSRKTSINGTWTALGAGSFVVSDISLKQNESVPISSYATISDVTPNEFLYLHINVEAGQGPLQADAEVKYLPPQDIKTLSPADIKKQIKK